MAAKSSAKKPKEEPKPAAPHGSFGATIRALFRPQWLLSVAILISALVFGPQFLQSLPDLNQRPQYRLKTSEIRIAPPPPRWVPEDFATAVFEQSRLPREFSLLDVTLVANVADAFRKHPWVADVVSVRKTVPAGLEVQLKFRQPVAVVEVPEGFYPIDRFGTLLPPADLAPAEIRRFPLIQNVSSLPAGAAGNLWGDPAVTGAARLAAALLETEVDGESVWRRYGLSAIRVPRRTSDRVELDDVALEILSTGGSRILWGRPPGTSHPGELSVEQKLGRLEKYVKDYGGFDRPHGPYEIDIRHWQEISRRSLAGVPRQRH